MSSIGGIGSNHSTMMQGIGGMKRPDPAQLAKDLFAKLDTSGQGYIQKADLQAAFDKVSSASSSSGTTSSVDDLFSQLDTDSDGKVTRQEFSDTLKQVAEQLDNQFMSMRMNGGMQGGGMGGMPPPPPPGGSGDSGFTKDELSAQLNEIGSSDNKRSDLISNIVGNFDEADTDGDGKVSFKEAMTYDQNSTTTVSSSSSSTSSTSNGDLETKLLSQIMKLVQAYGLGNEQHGDGQSATLSITA